MVLRMDVKFALAIPSWMKMANTRKTVGKQDPVPPGIYIEADLGPRQAAVQK